MDIYILSKFFQSPTDTPRLRYRFFEAAPNLNSVHPKLSSFVALPTTENRTWVSRMTAQYCTLTLQSISNKLARS